MFTDHRGHLRKVKTRVAESQRTPRSDVRAFASAAIKLIGTRLSLMRPITQKPCAHYNTQAHLIM